MNNGAVSIRNITRRKHLSHVVFEKAAKAVLPGWDISLVFVSPARARRLNKQLRNKFYTPNVLSYGLGTHSGEIIICLDEAKRQAPAYDMREQTFVLYLFIHGLLHLKGWEHGVTMEQCERKLLAKFAESINRSTLNDTAHSNGNRHRHVPSKDGRC